MRIYDSPNRLYDTAELQCPHSGTGQQRSEEKVVAWADDNCIKLLLVYFPEDAVTAPSRSQDH